MQNLKKKKNRPKIRFEIPPRNSIISVFYILYKIYKYYFVPPKLYQVLYY